MRVVPGLVGPGIPALAIALPIAAAAAAATTSAPLVTARLVAPPIRLGCKATGCFDHGFILHRVVSLRGHVMGIVMGRFGDRDLLDMGLGVVMHLFATAAPAAATPASATRSAFA